MKMKKEKKKRKAYHLCHCVHCVMVSTYFTANVTNMFHSCISNRTSEKTDANLRPKSEAYQSEINLIYEHDVLLSRGFNVMTHFFPAAQYCCKCRDLLILINLLSGIPLECKEVISESKAE